MKKGILFIAILVIAIMLPFAITGCTNDNSSEIVPTPDPGGVVVEAPTLTTAPNYLSEMSTRQASFKIEDEGVSRDLKAEFISSQTIGDIVFLQYKIGAITGCFINTVTLPVYNDIAATSLEYKSGKLTAQTISEGLSDSISTSASVSLSEKIGKELHWDISGKADIKVNESVGVNMGFITVSGGIEKSFSTAVEVGESYTKENSQSIAEAVTKETLKNLNTEQIEQSYQETTYSFDLDRYEKDYYYALCLLANVDIYQVIAYNNITGDFYTTYFAADISNTAIRMLTSDTGTFTVKPEYQIQPITEISIIPEGKTVIIPLSDYATYEGSNISSFRHMNFDNNTSVFTAYGSVNGNDVAKYIFKGSYRKPDKLGRYVNSVLEGFSIRVFSEHDIELVFENLAFSAANNFPAIYVDDAVENKDVVITLTSSGGENRIYGSNALKNGASGNVAIRVDHVKFSGDSNLYIYGGNAADASSASHPGGNGGVAVQAKDVTISTTASINFIGGRGGAGVNGSDGALGANGANVGWFIATGYSKPGARGQDGKKGSAGGDSGASLVCTSVCVKSGDVVCDTLVSGRGGDGGSGGRGGHGGTNNWHAWAKGGASGSGGNGADGSCAGASGNEYLLLNAKTIFTVSEVSTLTIKRGLFGEIGKGGLKGLKGGPSGDPQGDEPGGENGVSGKDGTIKGMGTALPESIKYSQGTWNN